MALVLRSETIVPRSDNQCHLMPPSPVPVIAPTQLDFPFPLFFLDLHRYDNRKRNGGVIRLVVPTDRFRLDHLSITESFPPRFLRGLGRKFHFYFYYYFNWNESRLQLKEQVFADLYAIWFDCSFARACVGNQSQASVSVWNKN